MKTQIKNIGTVITGDLEAPKLDVGELLIVDGRIASLGPSRETADTVIDAKGSTVAPGLIDSHVHVVFGDWTPRQNMIGWIESYLHGGITSMMSASEVHLPGRPSDPAGVKALAITAQRSFSKHRPGNVKVHAGSVILEPGLTEADFVELRAQGVWLAKMGFGSFENNLDAKPLVEFAHKYGFLVMSHTGGVSIPGSNTITASDIMELGVDIAGHVNGGTTSLPDADLETLIRDGNCFFQISQAGNLKSALRVISLAKQYGKLNQVVLSSDTPTGTGVMPLAVLKTVVEMASLADIEPEEAWALASGRNAAMLRRNTGLIRVGREADLVIIDAPCGSEYSNALEAMNKGDLPGISAVLIDGQVEATRSRNTPLAQRLCSISE